VLSLSTTAYSAFSFFFDPSVYIGVFRRGCEKFQLGIFRCLRLVGLRIVRYRICYGQWFVHGDLKYSIFAASIFSIEI
jgi:hypothetical protein